MGVIGRCYSSPKRLQFEFTGQMSDNRMAPLSMWPAWKEQEIIMWKISWNMKYYRYYRQLLQLICRTFATNMHGFHSSICHTFNISNTKLNTLHSTRIEFNCHRLQTPLSANPYTHSRILYIKYACILYAREFRNHQRTIYSCACIAHTHSAPHINNIEKYLSFSVGIWAS